MTLLVLQVRNSRAQALNDATPTRLRVLLDTPPNYHRQFAPLYTVDRGFIDAEVPGASNELEDFCSGGSRNSPLPSMENNVLPSLGSGAVVLALALRCRRRNFFSAISFAFRQFRASAVRRKDLPREPWYFARDVFPASTTPPSCTADPFSYFAIVLRLEFARACPRPRRPPPSRPFPLFYYFPSFFGHFRRNTGPLSPFPSSRAFQPRKSKLDAKTRPNVHNARRPTYRVSGTIADSHRFSPPGRDKCEDMPPRERPTFLSSAASKAT